MALAMALSAGFAMGVGAQEVEVPPQLQGLADSEAKARATFLEERLDAGQRNAQVWQYGWTGIFGAGTLIGAVEALRADDSDFRVYNIVGAVKSAAGVASMVSDPLPARLGADPMRVVPDDTPHGRLQRVALGERQLITNAARADTRYSWQRHLEGVTTNLIGGGVIYALGDSRDALISTLTGIAWGEAQIWTQPWRANADLADYRHAFPSTIAFQWELRPTINGAELAFRW